MTLRRIACAALGVTAALLAVAGPAAAWAPASTATIHPGVMTFSGASSFAGGASQCTANFVFTDASGGVYLGQAAHCTSTSSDTSTDGCSTGSLPLGTPIYAGDAVNGGLNPGTEIGTLTYNSWLAMQARHETDANTCAYNDLALIKIDPSLVGQVNPTVPFWGGPDGLAAGVAATGSTIYSYGNSILRAGVSALSPKVGASLGDIDGTDGWSNGVYTVTPGIPGDSGSGFLDSSGNALGILSTVSVAPLPAENNIGILAKELAYANQVTGLGLTVAPGTQPFSATPSPPSTNGLPSPPSTTPTPSLPGTSAKQTHTTRHRRHSATLARGHKRHPRR